MIGEKVLPVHTPVPKSPRTSAEADFASADSKIDSAGCDRACTWSVSFVLLFHALLLGWSATWQSPTLNEPGHLASGVVLWEQCRFDAYRVNPPLVRAVAALPVMVVGYKANWDRLTYGPGLRSEFQIGVDFVEANGVDSIYLFNLGRWACIPFSVQGGWCCFLWGRALCGPCSGLLACLLWCFTPIVLAAGQVIAPDMGGASFGLLASYVFWLWLKQLSWRTACFAGVTLGLAILARSSWLILFALWPALWLFFYLLRIRPVDARYRLRPQIGQLTVIIAVALDLINSAYLFEGTLTPLGEFTFVSQRLGDTQSGQHTGNIFKGSWLAYLSVPLPKEFVLGLDQQKKDFEAFSYPSYLRGEWRNTGWWYYYLYGFAVKVPLSEICLILFAICAAVVGSSRARVNDVAGWMTLFLPGIATVVILSSQPSLNHHFRYALPMFGPLFVFIGTIPFTARGCGKLGCRALYLVTVIAVIALIGTTLSCAPRFQSYFNLLAGGTRNGHRHLIHSSLDWGQDLYFLKEWLRERKIDKPINLAYNGFFDPADIGIAYVPATCGPRWKPQPETPAGISNLWVISVNYLVGDGWRLSSDCDYREFEKRTPIHICGDCLYVYEIP